MDDLITIRECARRAGMCEKTVRELVRNLGVRHYRNGTHGMIRLRWSDWMEGYERHRVECRQDDDVRALLSDLFGARA